MSKKNILAGILLTVMVLTSAIPAFAAETVCTHPEEALDWAYPYKKKPTCQETGLTDEICTICGAVVHADVVVPKDDHSYNVESVKNSVITADGMPLVKKTDIQAILSVQTVGPLLKEKLLLLMDIIGITEK